MEPPAPPAPPPTPRPRRPGRRRPPIQTGATVHVLAGTFQGKVGVVQELDGKGGARVVLGTMSIWVPVGDLTQEASARARPPLRSSHRKPGR